MHMGVLRACVCVQCLQRPERADPTGQGLPTAMSIGDGTQVLWKSSYALNH